MSGVPDILATAVVQEDPKMHQPQAVLAAAETTSHAIIIGGTSGLGREIALECLNRGVIPIIMGRNITRIQADKELKGVPTFVLDLFDPRSFFSVKRRFDRLLSGRPVSHIFWVAGKPQNEPYLELETMEIATLIGVHLEGPLLVLRHIFGTLIERAQPLHFVTISSTSAYKLRSGEEIYAAVKAAKAMFAYQMAGTLRERLPGSEVTLVLPGGMDTPFWEWTDRMDGVKLMNPAAVAQIIAQQTIGFDRLIEVERNFRSLAIERGPEGQPVVRWRHQSPDQLF